jgi:hypothetical protein
MAEKPKQNRRVDVLNAAHRHGWRVENDTAGEANDVVLDIFSHDIGTVRCVWVRTPWSPGGRYAGAIFSSIKDKNDVNLWKVGGNDKSSLLFTLTSTT